MYLLQPGQTAECRAVRTASYLTDRPSQYVAPESLAAYAAQLREGSAMPVGTVEYVREAMRVAQIAEPENLSYLEALRPWLHRIIRRAEIKDVDGRVFVKPLATKLFTGFVRDPAGGYDEHDLEQFRVFVNLRLSAPTTPVWTSDTVEWQSEVRYYVQEGKVIGHARYDPLGRDDAPLPDERTIEEMITAAALPHPYALDAGVLGDGRTALVECNDSWGLGLYSGALRDKAYAAFLDARWISLHRE